MSKSYRYDALENGGDRDFRKTKKQAKKMAKFEKRRSDRREFDDRADDDQEQVRR